MHEGPLNGVLKIKIPSAPQALLKYRVSIGTHAGEAKMQSFDTSPIATWHGESLDWIEQVNSDGSLLIAVEIQMPA